MRTLNFTGVKKASTSNVGYFPLFEEVYAYSRIFWERVYVSSPDDPSTDEQLFYKFGSTVPGFSLIDYFVGSDFIAESLTWNFSNQADYIELEPLGFYQRVGEYEQSLVGSHFFNGDIFNLGAGSDFFHLYLSVNSFDYSTSGYDSYAYNLFNGGFSLTINGGDGADYILVNAPEYTRSKAIPTATINAGSGVDDVSVYEFAVIMDGGSGADVLSADYFSDRINGGAGNDLINGSAIYRTRRGPWVFNQSLSQRDLITGGAGKDTFVVGSGYAKNGASDYAVITDFTSQDRLTCFFTRGDILIDPVDGTLPLPSSVAYQASSFKYTARLYLDVDDNAKLDRSVDDLLMYVCGSQPTQAQLSYAIF